MGMLFLHAKMASSSFVKVSPSHSLQTASPSHSLSNPAPSNSSPNTEGNPIGSLQELCMKNNCTPPSYDLVHDSGEAHSKTFIYECKVCNLEK